MTDSATLFNDDMTIDEINSVISNNYSPVVLLEGRRKVLPDDAHRLTDFALRFARAYPSVIFRTGNADGSDTYFAKGVAQADQARIQYVVPYASMKLKDRVPGASVLSYDELAKSEDEAISYLSSGINPKNKPLFDYARKAPAGRAAAKAKYLLRDTLKVIGSEKAGFSRPVLGFFYVDLSDPLAGGTGHTIKVCQQLGVPVITQTAFFNLTF
ncbi:MAG: hypothetical protein LAT84_10320 [Balneolia bacterium]|nr:hypothetical protein [Balneolia bacterium]